MPISEKIINNIPEYISSITDLRSTHDKLWFRGHPNVEYFLQPTVYRSPYSWKNERSLLHQFKARAARFIDNPPTTNIEWLFIMQHHATPTRLLDWSENAIIGPQNTDRIIAQRGVFTLFPNKDSFSLESVEHADEFLFKIIIPESSIKTISDDLYYMGMTESTIFPELDSISKELRKNYEGR